jgi:hypothetical protein
LFVLGVCPGALEGVGVADGLIGEAQRLAHGFAPANRNGERSTPMTDELDGMYDTFKALLDSFPPAEAVKRLEQFGITPEIVQQIRERHEQQTNRIKELEEPTR